MAEFACVAVPERRLCDIVRSNNAMARRARTCEWCGVSFIEKTRSSKQLREGKKQRFCSNQCRAETQRVHASKEDARVVWRQRWLERRGDKFCAVCNKKIAWGRKYCSEACQIKVRDAKTNVDRTPSPCPQCRKVFYRTYGHNHVRFCSKRCLNKSRKSRYGGDYRARARHFGVEYEPVNRVRVFDRDGWRCQLCGVKTPKHLRGTLEANAPELDHIVPLAAGGGHSYRNTQCACRLCNSAKHDRPLGQMRLFG